MRTLLAASGGGHLTQLVNLRDRLPFEVGEVTWFTMDTPQSRSMLAGESVLFAHPAPPRDWRAVLANRRLAGAAFRRVGFDAAVSTGASIALSALPVSLAHGAATYYIESAARVEGPSLTGRLLSALPGMHTACQYRTWGDRRWSYAGSVFDCFEPGPRASTDEIASAFLVAPVTMARIVSEDTEVGGCPMKAGDWVLLPFPAANRDPEHFERPDEVVLDRAENRHATFGLGIHRCAGSNLARMELRVAIEAFLDRYPEFTLDDPEAVTWAGGQVRGPRRLPIRIG